MTSLVLIVYFCVALVFFGYTGGWQLFDYWWGGGAVVCGALLLGARPVRIHRLSIFLIPALFVLAAPGVWTSGVVKNAGWWVLALFLFTFIPTVSGGGKSSIAAALFRALRWVGSSLTLLYLIQMSIGHPVRGLGIMRSAEALLLIGGLAGSLMEGRRIHSIVLSAGIFLNGSRAGILGFGMLLIGYLWIQNASRRSRVILGVLTVTSVLAVTATRIAVNPYAELRLEIFFLSLLMFSSHAIGSGVGTFFTEMLSRNFPVSDPHLLAQYAKVNSHAHNAILQWGVEGGIVGMSLVLAFVICSCLILFRKLRASGREDWPVRAAALYVPVFVLELMINITESLSPIRWLGLALVTAVTAEESAAIRWCPTVVARMGWIGVGAGLLFFGYSDLEARQELRIGMKEEHFGRVDEAFLHYQEALRLRPWDEQAALHLAGAAVSTGKSGVADEILQAAFWTDENPVTILYYGADLYNKLSNGREDSVHRQKGRFFMLALSELQACDPPRVYGAVAWSRTEAERRWRIRRLLHLEPRSARLYDDLAGVARAGGHPAHVEAYSDLASAIRRYYEPIVRGEFSEYSILNKNNAYYDAWLLGNNFS